MMKTLWSRIRLDQPAIYQIKLLGRLGQEWSTTLDNLELSVSEMENGIAITTLSGTVTDQAALHGLLNQIRDLGLVLLLVECLNT
jgi:hypothetical protein